MPGLQTDFKSSLSNLVGPLRKNFLKGGGDQGRSYDSAVEHLPRIWEALGSISNTMPKSKTNKYGAGVETVAALNIYR